MNSCDKEFPRIEDLKRHADYGYYYFEATEKELEDYYCKSYHDQRNLFHAWEENFNKTRWWMEIRIKIANLLFQKYFAEAKTLIDIGCGVGNDLVLFREQGYDVQGIEYSIPCCELAKKRHLQVRQGNLSDSLEDIGTKDIITVSSVMEHMFDPIFFLEEVKKS